MSEREDKAEDKLVERIREKFTRISAQRKSYSARAFARDLKVDHTVLHRVLKGTRRISEKTHRELARRLEFFKSQDAIKAPGADDLLETSSIELSPYLMKWQARAIYCLAATKNFKSNPSQIARILGIELKTVEEMIQLLFENKLLKKARRRWIQGTQSWPLLEAFNSPHPDKLQLQNYRELEQKGRRSFLKSDSHSSPHVFEFTLFSGDESQIKKTNQLIRRFQEDLAYLMSSPSKDHQRVFCSKIELFPLDDPAAKSQSFPKST